MHTHTNTDRHRERQREHSILALYDVIVMWNIQETPKPRTKIVCVFLSRHVTMTHCIPVSRPIDLHAYRLQHNYHHNDGV